MAFVKAVRNGHVIRVSKNSYESMFKDKGYVLMDKSEKVEVKTKPEEAKVEEEVEEIPVSDMNRTQLMEFAEKHNIDTSDAKNVREARKIIQEAIREHNVE